MCRRTMIASLMLIALTCAAADDIRQPSFEFTINGARVYTVLGFVPLPSGADLSLGVADLRLIPGRSTTVQADIGGGYERQYYYRNVDGTRYSGAGADLVGPFDAATAYLELGLIQELAAASATDATFGGFAFFTTFFRTNIENQSLLFDTSLPDRLGTWTNGLHAGVYLDSLEDYSPHKTRNGVYVEGSVEWAPLFALNDVYGRSDYVRLNGTAVAFVRVFDVSPDREGNLFSGYFGDKITVDWVDGGSIPVHVRQNFGARGVRYGLGGAIRGFEKKSYDAELKVVNNVEMRLVGPALGFPSLVPVLVPFVDAGYYIEYLQADIGDSGVLASAGVTVAIDVFDVVYVGVTAAAPLIGERIDGKTFAIEIPFGLHF